MMRKTLVVDIYGNRNTKKRPLLLLIFYAYMVMMLPLKMQNNTTIPHKSMLEVTSTFRAKGRTNNHSCIAYNCGFVGRIGNKLCLTYAQFSF